MFEIVSGNLAEAAEAAAEAAAGTTEAAAEAAAEAATGATEFNKDLDLRPSVGGVPLRVLLSGLYAITM
jgi:hypothetical protein